MSCKVVACSRQKLNSTGEADETTGPAGEEVPKITILSGSG
jgi:hypothetical protein